AGQPIEVRELARRVGMPLLHDETRGLWCLGPEAGGAVLTSAEAPDLELPDLDGTPFRLSALRGRKVLLLAWASW
ncbi:MAG: peroxiredoxin family protein, partial [Chloroflexota bacterium]|nr:peroxiredoxin family protein [Chloroflexota bacterium]